MATRPLRIGELFEVCVDQVRDKWEAGLRIGAVQSADDVWGTSLPNILGRMQKDNCCMWLWSGKVTMRQGSLLTTADANLDNIQV